MNLKELYQKAINLEFLNQDEALYLYYNAPLSELMNVAHTIRNIKKNNSPYVTWIIDRNVNTTNVCVANCKFCNFYRIPGHPESYITDIETYKRKIQETFDLGGEQLLLQGGHHPELGLDYYYNLFKELKRLFPKLKLHALGPPEIVHISQLGNYTYEYVLSKLIEAGMDSIPGPGAEILNDRVRRIISNGKCSGQEWLDVMRVAHKLGLTTTATMMFGHIETIEERIEHLLLIRQVQSEKPENSKGFIAFIPWPYQDEGTLLNKVRKIKNTVTADEYIRMIALSRILLPNIENIQASWLTVGKQTAQLCLYAGANDFGSIMIEENVVSAAGADYHFDANSIQQAIKEAGFIPMLRNQQYEKRDLPEILIKSNNLEKFNQTILTE
ncbi:MAG TPA: cyclic dehypoxanthinyl futalosine synthase [Bacteroidia bacterium]|nr:cyclic dehypoxanthinyl futalosine synthase [Bacteroidia bacterium]